MPVIQTNRGLEGLDSSPCFDIYFLCEHRKPEYGPELHFPHLQNWNSGCNTYVTGMF